MGLQRRGSQWWLALIAIAVVSCSRGRVAIRFGSLQVSERSVDY